MGLDIERSLQGRRRGAANTGRQRTNRWAVALVSLSYAFPKTCLSGSPGKARRRCRAFRAEVAQAQSGAAGATYEVITEKARAAQAAGFFARVGPLGFTTTQGIHMRTSLPFVATLGVCAVLASGTALAQLPEEIACAKTRAEVKADCIQFMKTHRWDEGASNWVLKTGVRPPEGVKSREEVKAERDKFLAANRWNDGKTMWEPIPGKARDMSQEPLGCELTRAEVKKDCVQFLKTHRFDEGMGAYVKK